MQRNLVASAVLFALLSATGAWADEAPLIPDCYAADQSQSEFRDCIRRANGTAPVREERQVDNQTAADVTQRRTRSDASDPPAGMREREYRAAPARTTPEDAYAGLPEPPPEAEGPPYMDGSPSDMDGPDWGPPYSREPDEGSPDYGPPPPEWGDGPPDDGPEF